MNEIVVHIESYDFDYEFDYGNFFQKVYIFLDLWKMQSYDFDSGNDFSASADSSFFPSVNRTFSAALRNGNAGQPCSSFFNLIYLYEVSQFLLKMLSDVSQQELLL